MIRKEAPRVGSVHRALVLLKMIIDEGSVSVTEAAHALDVNASTAQRLLATLLQDGFASQGSDRRYAAGPALYGPGLATKVPRLTDYLRPALESLYERSGETVHLAALFGTRILHLDGIEARSHVLRFGLRVGVWLPAHATASGKVMLADYTDAEVERRYADAARLPATKQAAVDVPTLLAELADVRASGVARNVDESEPGIAAIAISLGEFRGTPVSISLALPTSRYTPDRELDWIADLRAIAVAVAEQRPSAITPESA